MNALAMPGDLIAVASLVINIIGWWYVLGYRVKVLESNSSKVSEQLLEVGEACIKLTVLNEQTDRRIRLLEELVIGIGHIRFPKGAS